MQPTAPQTTEVSAGALMRTRLAGRSILANSCSPGGQEDADDGRALPGLLCKAHQEVELFKGSSCVLVVVPLQGELDVKVWPRSPQLLRENLLWNVACVVKAQSHAYSKRCLFAVAMQILEEQPLTAKTKKQRTKKGPSFDLPRSLEAAVKRRLP